MSATPPDKRQTPRTEVHAAAFVQLLGLTPAENSDPLPATIVDVSDRGMRLHIQQPVPTGQAVKIELGDRMFLGEVCYCAPAPPPAAFHIGIVTEQCLTGLSSLQHLISALQPDSAPKLERV
jgi:hypothetical protein